MSFSDNLENNLKNLEAGDERRDGRDGRAAERRRSMERARVLASASVVEQLRSSAFTAELMRHATRIGFGYRTKVRILWLGQTLRLEAREHSLDLVPGPDGVVAHWRVNGKVERKEKVDLKGSGETFARNWMDTVGPPPPPAPTPEDTADGGPETRH